MFWKIKAFGHFGQIQPFPAMSKGTSTGQTFHMSLFPGLYGHPLQRNSLEKHMFRKTTVFAHFGQIRPFPVAESGQKAYLHAETLHMSLIPCLYDNPLQRSSLEKLMFRTSAVFGHFGQIRPFPVAESGQNCQKADLQAKTFHMSLFPGLYDHLLQRYSLEKNR